MSQDGVPLKDFCVHLDACAHASDVKIDGALLIGKDNNREHVIEVIMGRNPP